MGDYSLSTTPPPPGRYASQSQGYPQKYVAVTWLKTQSRVKLLVYGSNMTGEGFKSTGPPDLKFEVLAARLYTLPQ